MAFKGLLMISLSFVLASGPFIDLFPVGSCPIVWTAKVGGVDSLRISSDGSYLSVGSVASPIGGDGHSGNGTVSMFASNSSRPLWSYATGFTQDGPVTVSMSEDGAYLSTGGDVLQLRSIAVFGRASGIPLWTLNTPFSTSVSLPFFGAFATSAVSGDGEYVAVHTRLPVRVDSIQDSIAIFRRGSAVPLWFYNTTHGPYPGPGPVPIFLSYEGALLTTILPDNGFLYVFSQHDNRTLWTQKGPWFSTKTSGTGDFVAAANRTSINIFGKTSNNTLFSTTFPNLYLSDFSRDGSTVAVISGWSGTIDATLHLYDRSSGRELFHAAPVTTDSYQQISGLDSASISGDGSRTALVTTGGGLFVYDRSGSLICSGRQGSGPMTIVAMSEDGRFVVTGNSQLTYFAVVSTNQTPYILAIAAGAAAAVAAGVFLFWRRRSRRRLSSQEMLSRKSNGIGVASTFLGG